jgi:hypothetical protein
MASLKDLNTRLEAIRGEASHAIELLRQALEKVEELETEQREAFENMPEGLQLSDRGQTSEARADAIQELFDTFEAAIDEIDSISWEIE